MHLALQQSQQWFERDVLRVLLRHMEHHGPNKDFDVHHRNGAALWLGGLHSGGGAGRAHHSRAVSRAVLPASVPDVRGVPPARAEDRHDRPHVRRHRHHRRPAARVRRGVRRSVPGAAAAGGLFARRRAPLLGHVRREIPGRGE